MRPNRSLARTQTKPTVTADGSGDVFSRDLPEVTRNLLHLQGFGPSASDLALEGLLLGIGPSGIRPEVNPSLKNIS